MEYKIGKIYKLDNCELKIKVGIDLLKHHHEQNIYLTYMKIVGQNSSDYIDVEMGNCVFSFVATLPKIEVDNIILTGNHKEE